ncbi:hypothetical protein [Pseudomonas sp. SCB32]|uniref:hypothetical protein n=1 Tax=Pseudomonas sp. SCB32 TaxID=2653853 RepID=UPI0012657170|nr:hypothetical protein [Pseudomonas sp. SCB32]
MPIDLDVVIDTPDYEVDMKSGLETLRGASDATRCITETVLTKKVPKRQRSKDRVRTILKKSFKGSYGQVFGIEILDDKLQAKYNDIGNPVFSELLSYFMREALYLEARNLSPSAQDIIDDLGVVAEELLEQLRVSSMENIHKVSTKFGHDVKIRYRRAIGERVIIARFNSETSLVLQAKASDEKVDITASITRLNINTGNGRLLIEGEEKTIAFGFGIGYHDVAVEAKKLFSENLNHNNGLENRNWKHLRLIAKPISLASGKVVKYIITGYHSD